MLFTMNFVLSRNVSSPGPPSSVFVPAPPASTSLPAPPLTVRPPANAAPTTPRCATVSQPAGGAERPEASPTNVSAPGPPWNTTVPGAVEVNHLIVTSTFAPPTRAAVVSASRPVAPSAMLLPAAGGITSTFER